MPAKVTLKVTKGALLGQEFVFDERNTCLVGRAQDCNVRLPGDEAHKTVSRHHCLLDLNPPDVRVRDFGSLNGTFVNGKKIGQRAQGQTPEQALQIAFPEYDLKNGDEIQLGLSDTVFRVGIHVPRVCEECGAEIPSGSGHVFGLSEFVRCEACKIRTTPGVAAPADPKRKVCAQCGKDVSTEVGENRQGEYVCLACKADPEQVIRMLLRRAQGGDESLVAIQGYTIMKEIGRGGMGAVYLARHDKTEERVAPKVMLPRVAADDRAKRDFLRETENTKALKHPNVVQLRDSGCYGGGFFFTIEYCDGGSVDKLMVRGGGKLSLDEALAIVFQALDGLHYAHHAELPCVKLKDGSVGRSHGLVHRDLKPHNLFLSGSGASRLAKVGDYGLSKAFDSAGLSGQTMTGMAGGTCCYMPRQQASNFKYARPEADVWAMAASLYNMLTGVFPRDFPRGKDPWAIVLQTDAVPIRKRDASIPWTLADVIDLALVDRSRELHFKTAAEFKQALEAALR